MRVALAIVLAIGFIILIGLLQTLFDMATHAFGWWFVLPFCVIGILTLVFIFKRMLTDVA